MKRIAKSLTALAMMLAMVLTLLPAQVLAAETVGSGVISADHYVNPVYADILKGGSPARGQAAQSLLTADAATQIPTYTSVEAAAAGVREQMQARNEVISIQLELPQGSGKPNANTLWQQALAHLEGSGTAGDYLRWQYAGYGSTTSGDGTSRYKITYTNYPGASDTIWYTTAAQEQQLTGYIQNTILPSLALNGKTAYQKVQAIYDWITKNVRYDYTHLNDRTYMLQFTAYAAAINKTAVCQGYANLFYRLANDAGIDCRVIAGEADGGTGWGSHAWNIVRLDDGKYYCLDVTWDAGRTQDSWQYFLKGLTAFNADHLVKTEENATPFWGSYAFRMSTSDYVPQAQPALATPTVTAATNTSGKPVLNWTKVNGAAQYEVWRSTTGKAGSYTIVRRTATLTYTDDKAAAGATYYYVVRAMNGTVYSKYSTAQKITCKVTSLAAPTVTAATNASGKPVLSWTKVPGAAQYEVWRSTTGKAGSYSIVRRTATLTYTDETAAAGATYYYVVRAMNGSTYSKYSAAQKITCKVTSLAVPTVTASTNTTGKPVLNWTKVNGAAQYEVWRSTTGKSGSYTIVRRTATLTYTDETAAAGTTYYYVVRAMNGSVYSKYSAAQKITCKVTSLAAPTVTAVTNSSGKPVLNWTKVNGAAQYEVWRSTTGKSGSYVIVRRTATLTYTDDKAAAGSTYYYVVRAMNGSVYSKYSAAQKITVPGLEKEACGPRAYWTLTSDGTLTISGTGVMYNYGYGNSYEEYYPAPWAQEGQPAVRKLVVENGITSLGSFTFCDLEKLTSVSLPRTLTWIGNCVFAGCTSLESIVVPEGVTGIGGDFLLRCTSLRSVSLPGTLKEIGGATFLRCTSLQSIVLPEGIRQITWRMFYDCTALRRITIPASVEWIDNEAFYGCTALTNVTFRGSRTEWQNMVFNTGNEPLRKAAVTCSGTSAMAAPSVTGMTDRNGFPIVQWNAVSGAVRYEVWRAFVDERFGAGEYHMYADWEKEAFDRNGSAYLYLNNGSLQDGATYSYRVRAVNANGVKGPLSGEVRIIFDPVLATPEATVTTNAKYQPVISWEKVPGAVQYEVWRYNEETQTDERVRLTSALTWTDQTAELGKTYWYYLRAYSATGGYENPDSLRSAWGYSQLWEPVERPEFTECYFTDSGAVSLAWTKAENAAQYEVWRSVDGGSYVRVRLTATQRYVDATVQTGHTYSYIVRGVATLNGKTVYSAESWDVTIYV